MKQLDPFVITPIVEYALREDIEHGDITTDIAIPPGQKAKAVIIAKEPGVCAGLVVAEICFRLLDPEALIGQEGRDGHEFRQGQSLLSIEASARAILMAERTALNFLQRMCGIATLSRAFLQRVRGTGCRVVDTRKTTPGLRIFEKYAVACGGCGNHRYGLADGILIKDNHIAACGGIRAALERIRGQAPHTIRVEIEVGTLEEVEEAIEAGADLLLLDNMPPALLRQAVALARRLNPDVLLEASGGITLDNIRQIAETGVDIASTGMLTHSYSSIDLSLKFQ
jgi:nicotinate-nucleotide pyrophosphorylase (carboxylating)